jgi:gliding motility-associated-like protein
MLKKLFLFFIVGVFSSTLYSQQPANNQLSNAQLTELEKYQKMKSEGTLPPNFNLSNQGVFTPTANKPKKGNPNDKAAGCGCYVTPDGTYTLAFGPNDDLSTSSLAIPFNFTLYGTTYTSLFINTNGNVSFGTSYSAFSSNPFPDPSFVMVAPFWGDVDTRGVGTVSYKITPTAMYVNWEGVGYYSSHTDKTNTFQLIITNGLDPVLPAGNNIAFCYEDMQWTTGDASSGTGGFGGTPSTVGVNKGDGTSFIQIGRFDQPGAAYDGGGGLNDGVSWLDNQSLYFNVASSTNIPPIANFTPNIFNGAGGGACDTLKMCGANDTLIIDALFLSPEIGETTTVTVNFNGNTGFTLLGSNPGNPADISVGVVALPTNGGMNTITYTATDDGVPAQTTIVDVNVYVDTANLNSFDPIISGVLDFCDGGNSVLNVAPSNLTSYIWNTGSIDTTITVDSTGIYWVTVENQGCYKTVSVDVVEHIPGNSTITGNQVYCAGDSVLLNSDPGFASYLWSSSVSDTLDSVYVTQGSYTVTVTDSFNCSGTSQPFIVTEINPSTSITGVQTFCIGETIVLSADTGFSTYSWDSGETTRSINAGHGSHTVTVTDPNGCEASQTLVLTGNATPVVSFTINPANQSEPNSPVVFTDASTIGSGNMASWIWNFDVGNLNGANPLGASTQGPHTVTYTEQGPLTVTLTVTSDSNCFSTYSEDYLIISDIVVPNVITPNGDGSNDFLVFTNLEYHKGNKLTILNRWGGKVYETENYKNDWNGEGNSEGTYFYVLTVDDLDEPIKGTMTIFK